MTGAAPRDLHGRPLRALRLSVIEACNFRCPYCMPAGRIADDHGHDSRHRLSFDDIERIARVGARLGVRKLRLTGGEPLLRKHLPELVARLAAVPGIEDLALTTNGSLLAAQAAPLRAAGLQRVTVSLDTLDAPQFARLSGGRGVLAPVLAGIAAAAQAGFAPVKLNCVVQRGVNDDHVLPLAGFAREHGHTMRFIEYMDVGTCNDWDRTRVVPSAELRARIDARWPLRPLPAAQPGEVAERHAFADGGGEVGFVSSVTAPFCGGCDRGRVSANGTLYTCLFAADGCDLRPALAAGDEQLAACLAAAWALRADRYSERRLAGAGMPPRKRVEMFLVGG